MKKNPRILAIAAIIVVIVAAVAFKASSSSGPTLIYQGPLTGSDAQTGQDELTGAKFAVDEYNKANPKVKVTLKEADDQGDGTVAASVAPGVAANKSVLGVIGAAYSGASLNSFPAYKAAGLTMVSPSATRVTLTDPTSPDSGAPVFHRVLATDKFQGPALVRWATKGVSGAKVYLVDDLTPYGAGLAQYAKPAITGAIKLAGEDHVQQKTADYTSVVAKVKSSGSNVVVYCGSYADAGAFGKALRDAGWKGVFSGGDGVLNSGFVDAAGKAAAEGARLTAASIPFEKAATPEQLAAFKKLIGVDTPGSYVTETYNATKVFLDCITAGNTTRETIATCVNTTTFTGVGGSSIAFDANGDIKGGAPVAGWLITAGAVVYGEIA